MSKATLFFLGVLFLCTAMPSLATEESKRLPEPLLITDTAGRSIRLAAHAKRIISLYAAFSDLLSALGAESRLIACTVQDGFAAKRNLPVVGTHMRPNLELISALSPDLILTLEGRSESRLQAESLRKLGFPVLELSLASFADIFQVTKILGMATGKNNKADALVSEWQRKLAELSRPEAERRVTVFFEVRASPLLAAGKKSIVNEIIHCAGGKNVVETEKKLVRVSEEKVLAYDPSVYIIQEGPMNPAPTALSERTALCPLSAAQKGRVLTVQEELFSRPGPNAIEACARLKSWLNAQGQ